MYIYRKSFIFNVVVDIHQNGWGILNKEIYYYYYCCKWFVDKKK